MWYMLYYCTLLLLGNLKSIFTDERNLQHPIATGFKPSYPPLKLTRTQL